MGLEGKVAKEGGRLEGEEVGGRGEELQGKVAKEGGGDKGGLEEEVAKKGEGLEGGGVGEK